MASGREYKCDLDLEVDAEMNPPVGRLDTQNSPLIPCGKGWTPEIQEIFRVSKGKTNGYIISPESHQALFLSGMDYFNGGMVAQDRLFLIWWDFSPDQSWTVNSLKMMFPGWSWDWYFWNTPMLLEDPKPWHHDFSQMSVEIWAQKKSTKTTRKPMDLGGLYFGYDLPIIGWMINASICVVVFFGS